MDQTFTTDARPELLKELLGELETAPRARIVARMLSQLLPDSAVVVYTIESSPAPAWRVRALTGGISQEDATFPLDTGTLGMAAEHRGLLVLRIEELSRDDYAHLDVRRTVTALSYMPLRSEHQLLGCIEVVSFAGEPSPDALEELTHTAETAAAALKAGMAYETERNAGLAAVSRMVQLYDIEKIFNATLEMDQLLPMICAKVEELMQASAVHLWLVDGDGLQLAQAAGDLELQTVGARIGGGASLPEQVAEDGEPRLQHPADQGDPSPDVPEDDEPSAMAAGLLHEGSLVGVLEVIRSAGQDGYTDEDLYTLGQVADSAAQALHSSSLLQAERKIEILQTLVGISQEITSTLNHAQVLQAVVDQPHRVLAYDRAAIALEERSRLTVRAVSGKTRIDTSSPEIAPLQQILRWVNGLDTEVRVSQRDGEINDPRPETREKFLRYFEQTGAHGFYALPLADDEGRLGVLSFESSDPDFLTDLHLELIKILAAQATVALRNASLYKEVPFIGVLEPLMQKKRRFFCMEGCRRAVLLVATGLVLLGLILIPVPMRVSGQALVDPAQTQYVRAEQDGTIAQVFVHEGQQVAPGTPLLRMADWTQRSDLAAVQARYNTATAEAARALVGNDPSMAGQRQLEANFLRTELARSTEQLSRMTLHAALTGTVTTPHLENLIGRRVLAGDPLLEMIDTSDVIVDVAISQRDVGLIHTGDSARIKLESLPFTTLHGRVSRISPAAQIEGNERVFFARISVPNAQAEIRPGMLGLGKVSVGLFPLGEFLFRTPALWVWSKLWSWFPL